MRFGKRGKRPLSWGWRDTGVAEEPSVETVDDSGTQTSEPATLQPPVAETFEVPSTMPRSGTGDHVVTSDPTQRLLTSLGRFQRHFMKAREGAPQDQWSDECMNHLIHGVEIALEQGWTDLVEALTETGRILQTYEDARRANACVPFLADSYEIMCLMVGDLIVDKVRPGVLRKWRDCYQSALEDLTAEGMSLVQDEEGGGSFHTYTRAHASARIEDAAFTEVSPTTESDDLDEMPIELDLGDLPPLTPIDSSGPSAPEMPFTADVEESESPFDEPSMEEAYSSNDLAPPEFDIALELGAEVSSEEYESGPSEAEPIAAPSSAGDVHGLDVEIAKTLDMLCDGLARIEDDPEGVRGTVLLTIEDCLHTLRERAELQGWQGSLAASEAMSRLCGAAGERGGVLGDRFFETAYAFGGVFGDARERSDDPGLISWMSECDALIQETFAVDREPARTDEEPAETEAEVPFERPGSESETRGEIQIDVPSLGNGMPETPPQPVDQPDAPAAEVPEPTAAQSSGGAMSASESPFVEISSAAPVRVEKSLADDPAAHFLETARQAIGSGATADAKLFAMQAAASIAQAQAKEAESRVRQAEIRLQETIKSIESARDQVKDAESQVEQSEFRVEEGKEQLAERGRHTHGVLGSLEGIRSRIADLDRRIHELQAQRDEASRQQSAAEDALTEARQQESDVKAQLDELKNAEQSARVQLEDARGQVKLLQRKQGEIEALMERARDSLTKFRESMADIDRTIELIRSAETSAALENDDLLF